MTPTEGAGFPCCRRHCGEDFGYPVPPEGHERPPCDCPTVQTPTPAPPRRDAK